MEQPSLGLFPSSTLHLKPVNSFDKPMRIYNPKTKARQYLYKYTYLIHLPVHTFHSDVLKVNSQQVYK